MMFKSARRQALSLLLVSGLFAPAFLHAQQQTPPAPADTQVPEAGGPGGDTGAIALPKKSTEEKAPPPAAPKVVNPPEMGNYSIRVDVPLVNVDVGVVLQKNRQFVGNLTEDNFRVFEDGVEQKISGFQQIKQPITAVLLLEFASNMYTGAFINDMRAAAFTFARQLRPEDYVAVITYDLHTHILTDFTSDKNRIGAALNTLTIPFFSDRNMFDALYETLDRLALVDGHKYIVLVGSGRDTFSKLNLDKILKKIRETPNVTIFTISTGQMLRNVMDARGGMTSSDLEYAQADNEMRTFAKMTGGQWYNPTFQGALPDIFRDINDSIRSAYVLSYHPTNPKMDGSYRKLKVEVVEKDGKPLRVEDEKHKPLKYDVVAREGYKAKEVVQ